MPAGQIVRTGFKIASRIAPNTTGRAAFRLMCMPMRSKRMSAGERRLARSMEPLLDEAQSLRLRFQGGKLQTYRWGGHGHALRGRVVLVHGWTGRALVMTAFVEPLRARGYEVVTFDLPAHGRSSGRSLNMPLGAEALQAVADYFGPFSGAITHSFGGPLALLAMEGGAPLARATPIPRLAMIAAPNRLDQVTMMFAHHIGLSASAKSSLAGEMQRQAGRPVEEFSTERLLAHTGTSALVIHDTDDQIVGYANARNIMATNPGAQLMSTSGLGHRRIIIAPEVVTAATDFVSAGRGFAQ